MIKGNSNWLVSGDGDSTASRYWFTIILGVVLAAFLALVNATLAILVLVCLAGFIAGSLDKKGMLSGAVLVVGVNSPTISTFPLMPGFGAITVAVACLALGLALSVNATRRVASPLLLAYRGGLVCILLLSVATIGSSQSFGARLDTSELFKITWLSLLCASLLVTFWCQISWRSYCVFQVLLGFSVFIFQDNLINADQNLIWISRTIAIAAVAALTIPNIKFVFRICAGIPLIAMTLLLGKDGPVAGLLVGLLLALLLFSISRSTNLARTVFFCLLWVGLFILAVFVPWWGGILSHNSQDGNVTYREFIYQRSFDIFMDSPITGLFATSPAVSGYETTYTHNTIIEVLLSWGALGLLFWVACLVSASVSAAKIGLLPLFATALVVSMFSGDFASNPEYWILGAASVAAGFRLTPRNRDKSASLAIQVTPT